MTLKNILINSRFKYANVVHDVKDVIDAYNETAEIPELDSISIQFNKLLNTYDTLIEEAVRYIDEDEEAT